MKETKKYLKMVCPGCGRNCHVVLKAVWTGDVYLTWDEEYEDSTYDLNDSTLDYDDGVFVCENCGHELFDTFREIEDYFGKKENRE